MQQQWEGKRVFLGREEGFPGKGSPVPRSRHGFGAPKNTTRRMDWLISRRIFPRYGTPDGQELPRRKDWVVDSCRKTWKALGSTGSPALGRGSRENSLFLWKLCWYHHPVQQFGVTAPPQHIHKSTPWNSLVAFPRKTPK